MQSIKTLPLKAFKLAVKPFIGTGIGRFRPVQAIYRYLASTLIPAEKRLVSINGYKMFVHMESRGLDGISLELLLQGTYEPYTTVLFKQLVKSGMTVVDIGANIGYFTLLAASLVGEKGKVFAFEPEPQNYALLVKNIELNGYRNVIPLQKAVSNKTGKAKLFIHNVEAGAHSLVETTQSLTEALMVDVVSLDEFFKDNECPIDIIKMDVGGTEMAILLGMEKIVGKNNDLKIFTECWPPGLQRAGGSPQEYWTNLKQFGFKFIYLINEEEQKLETPDSEAIIRYCRGTIFRPPTWVNLLCAKSPVGK